MNNRQNPEKEFIREQIKEKPFNKKKFILKVGTAALCGIVFALAAGIMLISMSPLIAKAYQNQENDFEESSESQTLPSDSAMPTEETQLSTPEENTQTPPVTVVEKEWTLEDYQQLQNQLYLLGGQVNKSMVTITSVITDADWFNNPYETQGTGSGVIIASNNTSIQILTEKKAIDAASKIYVTFIDDKMAEATLLKYDGNTGVAILSVEKSDMEYSTLSAISTAKFGTSSTIMRGRITIALGSPLGTSYSILTGNITSTTNKITTIDSNYSIFTTDIVGSRHGSGILINTQGEIIGLIMQDYSTTQAENTLTAVHISELQPIINMLLAQKDIPYLGLQISTVNEKTSIANQIPMGVYVKSVAMDSPAMIGGIQSGDVIIEIDGQKITSEGSYENMVLSLKPEETYEIVLKRQGANGYTEVSCLVTAGVLQ